MERMVLWMTVWDSTLSGDEVRGKLVSLARESRACSACGAVWQTNSCRPSWGRWQEREVLVGYVGA